MRGNIFLPLVILIFVWRAPASRLYAVKSPGCGKSCKLPSRSVVEVVYKNDPSSIHFVVSASEYFAVPSVFVVYSVKNSTNLTFDWERIKNTSPNSIRASGPMNSYGLAFLTLNSSIPIPLSFLSWRLSDFEEFPDNRTGVLKVTFRSEGSHSRKYFKNKGFVSFTFSFSTRNSHVGRSPHIFYDEGLSVLVDFTVSRLLDELSGPPLSLNTAFFTANQSLAEGQNFRTSTVSTINNELIHGVIETNYVYLNEIASTQSLSKPPLALVQWHPVFYTDAYSELKSSRQVMASAQTPPSPSTWSLLRQSVAYALLGPRPVALRLQNFTFSDSAFSTYITWSILLSLGSPHTEVFSTGLWSSLSISCGILAGIFVLACASMLIRWTIIRRRQDQFAHHLPLVDEVDSVLHAEVTVKT